MQERRLIRSRWLGNALGYRDLAANPKRDTKAHCQAPLVLKEHQLEKPDTVIAVFRRP